MKQNQSLQKNKSNIKKINATPGQPSRYDSKFIQMLLDYFNVKPYSENTLGKLEASDFPTLAGFATVIGVHRETLLNWTKVHPEFFDAYKRAKDFQESFLVVNGLKGLINPAFAIFTAKNVLNWRDKREIEVEGNLYPNISVSKLDLEERINLLKTKAN